MDFIRVARNAIPPEEHEAAGSIEHNLMMLQQGAEDFRRTVDLYLFAHAVKVSGSPATQELVNWIKIAGRHGAIVADSFSRLMEAINKSKAPHIWAKADLQLREKATGRFAAEFPTSAQIRNSAAHPGELSKSTKEQQKHRLKKAVSNTIINAGEGSGLFISDMMNGADDKLTFGASFKGDWVEYELSIAKADALAVIADLYCRAFYPLEHPSAAQQREWARPSDELRHQDQHDRAPWWHSLLPA